MKYTEPVALVADQLITLFELWNNEYPKSLAYKTVADLNQYLQNLKDIKHVLLIDQNERIQGWLWSFNREHERWFAIIVSASCQGKGYGSILLEKLKSREPKLHAWVIDHNSSLKLNGLNYISPIGFYKSCGFDVIAGTRLELETISAVKISWIRT